MTSEAYTCPGCGAPLAIEHRFSKLLICPYCGQSCFVSPTGLDPQGKVPLLADFPSILAIGKKGTLQGENFSVLGRLRFEYEDGLWDEWFVLLGEKKLWLQEDEGLFTAFEKETITSPLPAFEDVRVGSAIEVQGMSIFVVEKNEASIKGGEGELHFRVEPGERFCYVDGTAQGQVYSIEYAPDEIHLSKGAPIAVHEIRIEL